jgi:hypothetical protein
MAIGETFSDNGWTKVSSDSGRLTIMVAWSGNVRAYDDKGQPSKFRGKMKVVSELTDNKVK